MTNQDLAARFGKAAGADPKPAQPQVPAVVETTPKAPSEPKGSKFTVVFSQEEVEAFDEFLLAARRRLRRRVDKSEVLRHLLELAYSDPSLEQQLMERLAKRG